MQPKISIIVPIYNTELYLEKCLKSIACQTLQDIEVLCVDDASPDQSVSIVQDIAQADSRFKLIRHAKNLGQGGARNTGIAHAQADYIANVDSDDWIDPDMLELLFQGTLDETVDIVCCGWKRVNEQGQTLGEIGRSPGLLTNSSNELNIFNVLNPALWNKLIRKKLCTDNAIAFPHYLGYEDLATTPRLVSLADQVHIIPDKPYNYVTRENSVMTTFSPKHLVDYLEAFTILKVFLIEKNLYDRYRSELSTAIDKHFATYVRNLMASPLADDKIKYLLRGFLHLRKSFDQNFDDVEKMSISEMADSVIAGAGIEIHSSPSSVAA